MYQRVMRSPFNRSENRQVMKCSEPIRASSKSGPCRNSRLVAVLGAGLRQDPRWRRQQEEGQEGRWWWRGRWLLSFARVRLKKGGAAQAGRVGDRIPSWIGRSERMTPKEASRRLPNGAIELTGAKDADGIPVDFTSRDVERMGGEAVAEYEDRRAKLIAERKVENEDNLERWEGEGGVRDQRRRGGRTPGTP